MKRLLAFVPGFVVCMLIVAGIYAPAYGAKYSGAWTPTSSTVEYFNVTFTDYSADNNFKFFIYNRSTGNKLTVFNNSQFMNTASILFNESGGEYFASLGGNMLNLGARPDFWLGFDMGSGTEYEYSYSLLASTDQYQLTLDDKILISSDAAPVPLPASIWMLGSALAGLAGFGRRFMNI